MKLYLLGILVLILTFFSCQNQNNLNDIEARHLYHISKGQGSPILIVHGGPGLGSAYIEKHIHALYDDHQVIISDQVNSGRSPLTSDSARISLDALVNDIESLRKIYRLDRFTLLAHSWGGLLAIKYADQYPQHINGIVLVNSLTMDSELNNQSNTKLANQFSADDIQARTQILRSEAFQNQDVAAYEELMKIGFNYQFYNKNKLKDLDLQLPADFGAKSKLLGYLFKDLAEYNFSSELEKIKSPVLLLYGLKDPLSPIAINYYQKRLPDAKLVVVENSGHFPFIEQEEETIAAIEEFMVQF